MQNASGKMALLEKIMQWELRFDDSLNISYSDTCA